mgnify:CR=1 FL=1
MWINARRLGAWSAMAALCLPTTWAQAGNDQIVNSAMTGSAAVMNISTVKGMPVPPGNRQVTDVKGAVINAAGFGGYAEMNIASKTPRGSSGSQVISINGPVINQAFGRTSIVNIGGSR